MINTIDKEFRCPRCGSFKFGSIMLPDNSLERLCHGCHRFTWGERDDWKYFRLTRSALEAKIVVLEECNIKLASQVLGLGGSIRWRDK